MKSSEIFANDVLLNITGASIGRCCRVPENLGMANVNQHVCAIRIQNTNQYDAIYLSTVLESFIGQKQIEKYNAGGNREGLNHQQIRSFYIPWPKQDERKIISEITQKVQSYLSQEYKQYYKLNHLKSALMKDLLSGKVRLPAAMLESEAQTG